MISVPFIARLFAIAVVAGMGTASPVWAQSYPAEMPELEYLEYWRLNTTFPTGSNYADSLDISQPALATYQEDAAATFRVVAGGGVAMRAFYGGAVTSPRTAFSRTELREMATVSPATVAAWPCGTKKKEMTAKLRVTMTPKMRPVMSLAQIHDQTSDVLEVQYIYDKTKNAGILPASGQPGDKGRIVASWNSGKKDASGQSRSRTETLDANYVVGDTMTLIVKVNGTAGAEGYPGAGQMQVTYTNDTRQTAAKTSVAPVIAAPASSASNTCYFKAGNYQQACTRLFNNNTPNPSCGAKTWPDSRGFTWENQATANESSEVVLYQLLVSPKGN